MVTKTIHHGPAIRITQRNTNLYYIPILSKVAAEFIGYKNLNWSEAQSAFSGFNRNIKQDHVRDIVKGLEAGSVVPNSIIVYLLHDHLRFEGDGGDTSAIVHGKAKIVRQENDEEKIGFVIDGQHRLEALKKLELESGQDDLPILFTIFLAPASEDEREEFDKFVLTQMAIINNAEPLTENETHLVQQRIDRVMKELGNRVDNIANLVVKDLDTRRSGPVRFSTKERRPPKGAAWLELKTWVNVVARAIESQNILKEVFGGDYSESAEKRKASVAVLNVYLRAISGLAREMKIWEVPPSKQRLYHNVGLWALLGLLDSVNDTAQVFSTIKPGTLKTQHEQEAVRRLQKVLKPILLLEWSVGKQVETVDGTFDWSALKMAQIQQQKGIPAQLQKALEGLIAKCRELEQSNVESVNHVFDVRDSTGALVCRQLLSVSKERLQDIDTAIAEGQYDWKRPEGAGAIGAMAASS